MAKIGGWEGARGEEDDDRYAESVGGFDGDIQGGIVATALGALHPVDHAGAVGVWAAGAAGSDAGIAWEFKNGVHYCGTRKISCIDSSSR